MNTIEEKILSKLAEIENTCGFRVLFAVESGSRAWGFASADSDYDVRFVYAWDPNRYLAVSPIQETIETGIDADAIDLSGWEFRKALRLFRKSNGALCEWLRSPIVYREDPSVMNEWRRLLDEEFGAKANAIHYLGLSRQMWHRIQKEEKVTAKRYLYSMRALLCAQFVIEQQRVAPVPFEKLVATTVVPPEVKRALEAMIVEKSGAKEQDRVSRDSVLEGFVTEELERLSGRADALEDRSPDAARIDSFFRSTLLNR